MAGTETPISLYGITPDGALSLLKGLEPLWARDPQGLFPDPQRPFLVSNDTTPATGQLTEEQFFEAVATAVSRLKPHDIEITSQAELAITLALLGLMSDALRPLFSIEALIRKTLGVDAHAQLDPIEQAERLARLLAAEIRAWHDVADLAGAYTPDWVKEALITGQKAAQMPINVYQAMTSVPIDRPPGTAPSSAGFGRRIHRFIQTAYVTSHMINNVICDGRWTYAAFGATISKLIDFLTDQELDQYSPKILIFREAMLTDEGGLARPDICDLDEDTAYEIKPRIGARDAYGDLWTFYIPLYNRRIDTYNELAGILGNPPLGYLDGGFWTPPPLYYDPEEQALATIMNVGHGAIVYDVYRVPEELLVKLAAFLIAMALLNAVIKKILELNFPAPPQAPPEIIGVMFAIETLFKLVALIIVAISMAFPILSPIGV